MRKRHALPGLLESRRIQVLKMFGRLPFIRFVRNIPKRLIQSYLISFIALLFRKYRWSLNLLGNLFRILWLSRLRLRFLLRRFLFLLLRGQVSREPGHLRSFGMVHKLNIIQAFKRPGNPRWSVLLLVQDLLYLVCVRRFHRRYHFVRGNL